MTDIIQLLPDAVANQIAAGEVIQRPASVIKELVENSIDSGATKIQITIKDAGRTLIQVTDNGKGMSPSDARMAFERHATSKISSADDLFSIKTMGFRGEALASIVSVADVELSTKQEQDEIGTFIHIAGSELKKQEVISCVDGTTLKIKNLFFNVPARRKFLKSNSTELKHILNEFHRVALANPEIAFSIYNNDSLIHDLPSANNRKRIVNLFGNNMNQSLIPIESETSLVKISGFVGQPKFAKRTFGEQFFFVNNRYMKHFFFNKAVMQGYEKILPKEMFPSYFIFLEVDPNSIDINIHPTKTEIKFENESSIWQLLHAAVREGLGKFNVVPSIDFDQEGNFEMPATGYQGDLKNPSIETNPNFNPFEQQTTTIRSKGFSDQRERDSLDNWESLYKFDREPEFEMPNEQSVQSTIFEQEAEEPVEQGRNIILLKNKYILTPVKSGLMVIDQRRAHIRILFEAFKNIVTSGNNSCQQLLFPQTIEVNSSDAALLESVLEDLNRVGFDVRSFGQTTYIVNGIPGMLSDMNIQKVFEEVLEDLKTKEVNFEGKSREKLAISLAKAAAINYGQAISEDEAGQLIDNLFACETPNYTPSGKTVLEIIQLDEIEKKLK